MKLLSIAIPCYNSEAYMENCIKSLLPGGDEVEILVIDDGSKDRTAEIADEYQEKYPGIVRAIHQPNLGHGGAVNTGIHHAQGLYFQVVDSDDWVHEETVRHGGIPAPLDYEGFPKSVCTSINEVVCHGIPDEEIVLKEGDIVNVDVSTIYQGYFSDSSRMFCIGQVSPEKEKLVRVTKECVELGLEQVKPWTPIGNMGSAVHKHAVENGYTVVREIGGHGVGLEFHEDPWVSYTSKEGSGVLMVPGMIFTIEPMVNMGSDEIYTDEIDDWTVRTEDGLPSAQWEIMVLVTETGHEVLCW